MAKIILDLCGGTGAWSRPYRNAGYRVHLITLPDYDVTKCEITDRQLVFWPEKGIVPKRINLVAVYGILAAPPCTEFSLANTRQKYALRPNWQEGMICVKACLDIIWACMAKGHTKFWALENPFGHLRKFLGVPEYNFESWWFDAEVPWIKRTELWGYFKKPVRTVDVKPTRLSNAHRDEYRQTKGWYRPECPEEYKSLDLDRAAIRAITPTGFANAFAKANR